MHKKVYLSGPMMNTVRVSEFFVSFHARIQRGGGGGGRGSGPPSLENHKKIGFLRNTGSGPLKCHKCWAIISKPAKCHLNGFSLAGR